MAVYGFGKKNIKPSTLVPVSRNGYYVPGQGTFERQPNVYFNDVGEKVVQSAGVLRKTDGSLHQAYAAQPGSYISSLIEKQKRGDRLSPSELDALRRFYSSNPTAGLPSVNNLGGNHNGGIATKVGTKDRNTNSSSGFNRVERSSGGGRTFFVGGRDNRLH